MTDDTGEYRKYRKEPTQGKGDRNRVSDNEAFRQGWDRIFNKDARNKQSKNKKTGR